MFPSLFEDILVIDFHYCWVLMRWENEKIIAADDEQNSILEIKDRRRINQVRLVSIQVFQK